LFSEQNYILSLKKQFFNALKILKYLFIQLTAYLICFNTCSNTFFFIFPPSLPLNVTKAFMFSYITWIILQFVEPFYTYKCLTCYKKLKTICEPFSLFNFEHKELCKVKEFTRVLATQFSWNTHAYVYEKKNPNIWNIFGIFPFASS